MALRRLCAGLRTTARRCRADQASVSIALVRPDLALLPDSTLVLPWSQALKANRTSLNSQTSFAAQAQALVDQAASEPAPTTYRIEVVTGDVRGAGTQAPAIVTLYGESGNSADYIVGNETDETGFERGSSKKYEFNIDNDLGILKRIHVEQCQPSVTDTGSGWFLDKIEVVAPDGQHVTFPCHSWIGKNDAGDISGDQAKHKANEQASACHSASLIYFVSLFIGISCAG